MKKCFIVLAVLFLLPFALVGCTKKEEKLSSYDITLSYDDESKILSGKEEISYINSSDNLLSELHFHLYPNAFRENAKNKVVSLSNRDKAYPNGESFGSIEIDNVQDENGEVAFSVAGEDENILIVPLATGIYPDESVKISITFKVKLANINHRLGYGDNVINFGNFYPIACVYEDGKGFCESLYHSNGDPFYSDAANYQVSVTFSNSFTLASSGEVISQKEENGNKIVSLKLNKARDFAFCLSKKFVIAEKEVKGTKISYYGYEGDNNLSSCIEISKAAVEYFSNTFGEYPYKTLAIVKTNFVHGGMEYPSLVMISDTCQSQEEEDYVIVHEIAHQWWYAVVGNDEYNHAWQDESLAEYSTLMFFENRGDKTNDYQSLIKNATANYKFFVDIYTNVLGEVDTSMDRPLNKFETEPEYVSLTYTKGTIMYHTLREMVGKRKFEKALKNYYEDYKFKNPAPEELIASFSKSTGHNLEGFFTSWLGGTVVVV